LLRHRELALCARNCREHVQKEARPQATHSITSSEAPSKLAGTTLACTRLTCLPALCR
jgi:hypothetical protein